MGGSKLKDIPTMVPMRQKIYIAGHRGMVGSAIVRQLLAQGHASAAIVTRLHAELDLTNQAAVRKFFEAERPDQVYLAAAKVGGIHANATYPADFIYQNLMMQANVIDAAFQNGVQKLLFLGSSCIYPRLAPQPMVESALLTGPLEPTNEPYAISKIAGIKLSAKATTANTAPATVWTTAVSCPLTYMDLVTTTTRTTATSFLHCYAAFMKPRLRKPPR